MDVSLERGRTEDLDVGCSRGGGHAIHVRRHSPHGAEIELASGLAIDEVAQTLWLSRHTVRDHVKAIFSKVAVTSRPELTAKLFAEQFLPELESKQPSTT